MCSSAYAFVSFKNMTLKCTDLSFFFDTEQKCVDTTSHSAIALQDLLRIQ